MTAAPQDRTLLTVKDAAERLAVCNRTILRMIDSGQLPAFRVGTSRIIRIDAEDLDTLLRSIPTDKNHRTHDKDMAGDS